MNDYVRRQTGKIKKTEYKLKFLRDTIWKHEIKKYI